MNTYHPETIKKLLYRKVVGDTLTSDEEKMLADWRAADTENEALARRILSYSFVEKALTDNSRQEAQHSWYALRCRMGYRAYLQGSRLYAGVAVVAVLVGLLVWFGIHRSAVSETEYVLYAGTEKAVVYLPDGERMEMNDRLQYNWCIEQYKSRPKETSPVTTELSPDLHHTVVVPRGGEYTLTLEDGTEIHLNAQSSLTVPTDFTPQNRSVNLAGEAYFRVTSDKEHPFIVQTGRADIKVLGTAFNVKSYAGDPHFYITLEEGEVEINSAHDVAHLVPGQQAVIDENGQIEVRNVDIYLYCAWDRQRIAYDNETLLNILTDLGRWYDFEAAYSSDRLRNMRVSMDIEKSASFNRIAELLSRLDKIQIEIKKNQVIVRE